MRRAPAVLVMLALSAAAPSARAGGGEANGNGAAAPTAAEAERPPVVIWPALTPAGDAPATAALHKPAPTDKELFERAQELDATLRDAVQDLGFTLYVADTGPAPGHTRDEDLVERAAHAASGGARNANEAGTWVVSPRIEAAGGGQYVVRIVTVAPTARELHVRVETVAGEAVGVRGLVMLRDLLSPQAATAAAIEHEREQAARGTSQGIMSPLRSEGRAVLAVGAGLFGAFTAFALQRASGSDDPRVLYPLLALGTGIGIGGALLVADEWDVTLGDAWFLMAGGAWAAASGFLLAAGQDVQPFDDRYAWGVGSGLAGIALATFALTRTTMDDGDATLAHSGGALGLLVGGATQLFIYPRTAGETPYTGMGYGSAVGLLAAGVLATQVRISPSRVLLIDVGAGGGALLGAAAASPLIFQNQTDGNTRGWLSATLAGSVVGGALTWWLTREPAPKAHASLTGWPGVAAAGAPQAGIIGTSISPRGPVPIYGLGWSGGF
jgi:hypothetical protein